MRKTARKIIVCLISLSLLISMVPANLAFAIQDDGIQSNEEKPISISEANIEKRVIAIAVCHTPTKLIYEEGSDNLDLTGGQIKVYYSDDTTEIIDINKNMVSGFNSTLVGKQELTVTYEGKTTSFEVEITEKMPSAILIERLPYKREYIENFETLNVSGGQIKLLFDDGYPEKVINMTDDMITGFDNSTVGVQTLTVHYGEITTTFEIEVVAKSLSGISIGTKPEKSRYLKDVDVLDLTGGKLTLHYNNGTSDDNAVAITADMVSGFNNTTVGTNTLTVTYREMQTTFDVQICVEDTESFAGGIGSKENPYLIITKEHLNNVRYHLDACFKMLDDITFGEEDFEDGGAFYNNGNGWEPIGDIIEPFTGSFDGGEHTVENLIVKPEDIIYTGLFGYNIGYITSIGTVDGQIEHIANGYGGAIVGYNNGIVNLCYNTGKINACGGIVGRNDKEGLITKCYNTGNIVSGGGIALKSYGQIKDCYNVGNCYSKSSGNIVYDNSGIVENCYNIGNTLGGGISYYNEGIILHSYYIDINDKGVGHDEKDSAIKCTTEQLAEKETFVGFDFGEDWEMGSNEKYPFPIIKGTRNIDTIICDNSTEFAGGTGLISDPYRVRTKQHLDNVRKYLGANYVLEADIAFTQEDFEKNGEFFNEGKYWKPIGMKDVEGDTNIFFGYFDGNGYSIEGLRIKSDSKTDYGVGLFAENEGIIDSLYMKNGQITFEENEERGGILIGSIVGVNYGIIKGCYNGNNINVLLSDDTYIGFIKCGGIVGGNNGLIEGCYNKGKLNISLQSDEVIGYGGITGENYSTGTINKCYNIGAIHGSGPTGGIAGFNFGYVYNCYNTGEINGGHGGGSGIADNNGGIIQNCYNVGVTYGSGIADSNHGTIENCYYLDISKDGVKYNYGKCNTMRCAYESMKMKNTFSGFDFNETWTIGGNTGYYFPYLFGTNVDYEKNILYIAVTGLPEKTEYLEAKDHFDDKGLQITIYYSDGTTEQKSITQEMVSGFDNTKVGPQTLTVTYGGKTATFNVCIIAKKSEKIEISKLPTKNSYYEYDDKFEADGGKILIYYNNETTEEIELTEEMISGFDNTKVGKQTLTVNYDGHTTMFEVEIVEKKLSYIEIAQLPLYRNYLEGKDDLNLEGGKIRLHYNNGKTEEKDITADMVRGFDNTKVGLQTLTVFYEGAITTFEVEIMAKALLSIEILNLPYKLEYLEGKDKFDATGGKILLCYNNGTEAEMNITEEMVSGFNNAKLGKQMLIVSYNGQAAFFEVEIIAKTLSSIEVSRLPNRSSYLEAIGELDLTGGKILLKYNNGTMEEINLTEEMVSGFDNTKVGPQTLTVSYGGKTATFDVEITAKEVIAAHLSQLPDKTSYLEGKDELDLTGGKILLKYNNGTMEEINLTEEMVSGFDNTKVGPQTIDIIYEALGDSFQINIIAKSISSVELIEEPIYKIYEYGDGGFSAYGGQIKVNYNNDTYDIIDVTNNMVSGFDEYRLGIQTITITYKGETAEYDVNVIPADISGYDVSLSYAKVEYDGTAKYPSITVDGLKQDSDYTVEYMNNIEAGTAQIIITGMGNYQGTITKSFEIVKKDGAEAVLGDTNIKRIFGSSRYETSMKTADAMKLSLGIDKFDTVIVASGENYADALAGSYLARIKKAPILVVNKYNEKVIKDYITKNIGPNGKIYILGGIGAVSDNFEKSLSHYKIKRLGGANRYETNMQILQESGGLDKGIVVCSALDFADSLSVSSAGKPILLVNNELYQEQMDFINKSGSKMFYLIGGSGAVSNSVQNTLERYGKTTQRIAGENRFETSVKVAGAFAPKGCHTIVLASGNDFPDGLVGGPLGYFTDSPLILINERNTSAAASYKESANITGAMILGGPQLISDRAVNNIMS